MLCYNKCSAFPAFELVDDALIFIRYFTVILLFISSFRNSVINV
jgi:hypothetical protein